MIDRNNRYFATSWYPNVWFGIAAITISFLGSILFYSLFSPFITSVDAHVFGSSLCLTITMVWLFFWQKKRYYPDLSLVGYFNWHDYKLFMMLLIGLDIFIILISWLFGIPDEPFMENLLNNKNIYQSIIIIIPLVLFAPISEEILFRHFIFAIFPFNLGDKMAVFSVIFSALLFSLCHIQYVNTISYVSIFICGIILAIARMVSQGLLLPILLHASINAMSVVLLILFSA